MSLRQVFRIFFFFIGLGVLTNLLSWGPSVSFDWDVLGFIGLSWLVMAALLRYRLGFMIDVLGLSCLLSAPFLTHVYGSTWISDIFIGSDHRGVYWPFFPWFGTVVFGFRLTEFLWEPGDTEPARWKKMFFGGAALLTVVTIFSPRIVAFDDLNIWGAGIFKPGYAGLLAVGSAFCMTIGAGAWWLKDRPLRRYGFLNAFSTGILWIYVVHQIVGANLSYWLKKVGHLPAVSLSFFALEFALSMGVGILAVYFKHHRIRLVLRKSPHSKTAV